MRILLTLLLALPAFAEKINVPLRDSSRPALVKVSSVNGQIQVRAHSGKDVIVDTDEAGPRVRNAPNGMKQILAGHGSISIEEENNVVTVKPGHGNGSVVVMVPEKSSVHLRSVNGKEMRIEGVEGEINAETTNGSIVIVDAAGPIVAHAQNGRLTASLKQVPAGKPMSFSTLNGRIDVTLPSSARADLKINNQNGQTYSDFDIAVTSNVARTDSGRDGGPRYRLQLERTITAKINGGGPEIAMRSMNGSIYIRSAK